MASEHAAAVALRFPSSLAAFGHGYPQAGDPCRRLGETATTAHWLDASADLVGCPTVREARSLGGKILGKVEGITVVSVPTHDENAGMKHSGRASVRDKIRGKGGLEARCLTAVGKQGTKVIGTNRIEESKTAVDVYVNVQGGQAPWRCRVARDGKIESVDYTGSEGEL